MAAILNIIMFLPICLVASLVCTAVRLDDGEPVLNPAIRMFLTLTGGIALFCVAIYLICLIAGSEFPAVW